MHSDIAPGRRFPDFVLPDRTRTAQQLSALQGDDPMLLVLIRSLQCPRDREQIAALGRVHALPGSPGCKLVAITTDALCVVDAAPIDEGAALSALLHDETRQVRDRLDIAVLTDDGDERPMIPHTFLLAPGLSIRKVWNGRHPWGRPTRGEPVPRSAAAPCVAAATIDQTLNDMVAAQRDGGHARSLR
jgi:peroxiredoxin